MPHKSRLAALVIDCRCDDLSAHVTFWSRALGYEPVYFDEHPDYVGFVQSQGMLHVRKLFGELAAKALLWLAVSLLLVAETRRTGVACLVGAAALDVVASRARGELALFAFDALTRRCRRSVRGRLPGVAPCFGSLVPSFESC